MTVVSELITAWSDIVQGVFLGLAISISGLQPSLPLWGPIIPLQVFVSLLFLILYTIARLAYEVTTKNAGPREFFAVSIIYATRWIWLVSRVYRDTTGGRLYHSARALKHLKTLRIGTSNHIARKGQPEIVIREGRNRASGSTYFRGVQKSADKKAGTWLVRLIEPKLYVRDIGFIGTMHFALQDDFKHSHEQPFDIVYKAVYDMVIRTVPGNDDEIKVDFVKFFDKWKGVPADTYLATSTNSTDDTIIGSIARSVASSVLYYARNFSDADFRTKDQVDCINQCIEAAVEKYRNLPSGADAV